MITLDEKTLAQLSPLSQMAAVGFRACYGGRLLWRYSPKGPKPGRFVVAAPPVMLRRHDAVAALEPFLYYAYVWKHPNSISHKGRILYRATHIQGSRAVLRRQKESVYTAYGLTCLPNHIPSEWHCLFNNIPLCDIPRYIANGYARG